MCYEDLQYNEIGQYWGGYVDVDKPFNFISFNYYKNQTEDKYDNPVPKGYYDAMDKLNEEAKANIIGIHRFKDTLHSGWFGTNR